MTIESPPICQGMKLKAGKAGDMYADGLLGKPKMQSQQVLPHSRWAVTTQREWGKS